MGAGSLTYTAPEVLQTGKMTKASDVYSFAVLLLELWSGCAFYPDQNYYGVSLQSHPCKDLVARQAPAAAGLPCAHTSQLIWRGIQWGGSIIIAPSGRFQWAGVSLPSKQAGQDTGMSPRASRAPTVTPEYGDQPSPAHAFADVARCTCVQVLYSVLCGYRPAVPADAPAAYRALLEDCWAADPALRPTFTAIHDRLAALLTAAPAK